MDVVHQADQGHRLLGHVAHAHGERDQPAGFDHGGGIGFLLQIDGRQHVHLGVVIRLNRPVKDVHAGRQRHIDQIHAHGCLGAGIGHPFVHGQVADERGTAGRLHVGHIHIVERPRSRVVDGDGERRILAVAHLLNVRRFFHDDVGGCGHQTRVQVQENVAGTQGHHARGARLRIGVRVDHVVARLELREEVARRQVKVDRVAPRRQAVETVDAGRGAAGGSRRGRGTHQIVGGVKGVVAARARQRHGDAGNARLARILQAVGVAVQPDEIADFSRADETGIPGQIHFLARQFGRGRQACGRIDVAVHGIAVGAGHRVAARRGHAARGGEVESIRAARQMRKLVQARRTGDGRADGGAVLVQQRHLDTGNARLAGILPSVAVEIVPGAVPERGVGFDEEDAAAHPTAGFAVLVGL